MPFSPQTIDFLTMNRLNDSKTWFNEHKDDYRRFVAEPFREFTEKLLPEMQKIDPLINSVRISRIYRDARYSRGKSVFRENMWCTLGRTRELYYSLPCFYFDISANGFEYGCGFYEPARETMDAMREMIKGDSPLYIAAADAFSSQSVFELYGDVYKRNHFPDQSEEKCLWLNRKNIGLTALSTDWDILFSDRLADKIAADIRQVVPVYDMLLAACEAGTKKE